MTIPNIKIYSDGSCSPNPGPGGWAAVLMFNDGKRIIELSGYESQATNNRMELIAAIKALESLERNARVEMYTDSRYLQRGVTEWLERWQRNGWLTSDGMAIKNIDLWQILLPLLRCHQVEWFWVKGHGENKWNKRADELAAEARNISNQKPVKNSCINIYLGVTWKNSTLSGSWVTILTYDSYLKILYGKEEETTANRLYLTAVIEGLKVLKQVQPVTVYTRSGYLRSGMDAWLESWKNKGWTNTEGKEISNKLKWLELYKLKQVYPISTATYSSKQSPCFAQEAKELARELQQLQCVE